MDVRTERSWRVFIEPAVDNLQGRWLSTVHDPYGWVDDALQTQVFIAGRGAEEAPKRVVIAGTPWSAQRRPLGSVVTSHQAQVVISEEPGARSMSIAVEQRLTLTARGPTSTIALSQPFFFWPRRTSTAGSPWPMAYDTLTVETADGRPQTRVATAFGTLPSSSRWRSSRRWNRRRLRNRIGTSPYRRPKSLIVSTITGNLRGRARW